MSGDRSPVESLTVYRPDAPPELTPELARALLAILIEQTEIPVLDGPVAEVSQ